MPISGFSRLILALVSTVVILLSSCTPQAPEKVYQIGVLIDVAFFADTFDGIKSRMQELGYVEGENVVYELKQTNIDFEEDRHILERFVADKKDLIITIPTEATLIAKEVTVDIPIIFAQAFVENVDMIKSIDTPGGNLTGVRFPGPDISAKRFEYLLEMLPEAKNILVPYLEGYPNVAIQLKSLNQMSTQLGASITEVPISNLADLEEQLLSLDASKIEIDGILLIADPIGVNMEAFDVLGWYAKSHSIPVGGVLLKTETHQSLFGLMLDNQDVGRLAAGQIDKVLRGIPPGEIPVLTPEYYLELNSGVAKELGIELSDGLLRQATAIH